jgi:ADP-heptose:LPS heptosyltransferase
MFFKGIKTKRIKFKMPSALTLRQFYERRNKVLILRETGGLGDLLMHRMIFEDFKKLCHEIEIHFACLPQYHAAIQDHPFIDKVLNSKDIEPKDYINYHVTTCACTRYEMSRIPYSGLNRSDIWANHCGVKLTEHNAHIKVSENSIKFGRENIERIRNGHTGPGVLLCPISAMVVKNLTKLQLEGIVKGLRERGCFVYACHTIPIQDLAELNVPTFVQITYPEMFGLINESDYVISVDTGQFHLAGMLKRPLTGIFTFADGIVYGRHYKFELVQKHRNNGDWDCGPCYNWANCKISNVVPKPCLTEITVEMILDGIDRMFKRWPHPHYYINNGK